MGKEIARFRPAPIDDRATWDAVAADAKCRKRFEPHLAETDSIQPTMPLPTAADYLAAKRSNDRARLDRHWRQTRPDFARLVLQRLLKGIDPKDADDRLLNWTFALVHEPTWVVSAHLAKHDLPLSGEGQLDLAACEAACELAEMREVMLPWIETNSQTLGATIVRELDRRVLTPIMSASPGWADESATRESKNRLSNWTGVCAGSILAACMSLEATGHPRDECRDKMIRLLRVYFDVGFSVSGECDEGIGYWNYGIEFAVLGMSRLTWAQLQQSFDLNRVKRVAGYPERSHLFGRLFFVGNDGESLNHCSHAAMPWLAGLVDSDFLRWWSSQGSGTKLRTLPHWLRALQPSAASSTTMAATIPSGPAHDPNRLLVDQQAALFQRQSNRGLFTFTITGGTNNELHNHNDLGTFQLFVDDRAIIPDLGCPEYVTDYFNDKFRYTMYMSAASSGHCCPAINGVEQRFGKEAAGKLIGWHPESGEISLDLTSAYPPEARLKRWTRSAHVPADDAIAIVTDVFELDGDGEVVHRIWFVEEPKISDGGAIIAADLDAAISIAPKPDEVELFSIKSGDERLMMRGWKPEKMLDRVDLRYRTPANTTLTLTTHISIA